MAGDTRKRGLRATDLLLAVPFIALLPVPFYNRLAPDLAGIPFFYWYQLLWVPLTSLCLWAVHRARREG